MDADARKQKPKPARVPYTVTVDYRGTYWTEAVLGGAVVQHYDETTTWTGTSTPFALVRVGTRSKPQFRIAPYGGTSSQIQILGPVSHSGGGFTVGAGGCGARSTETADSGASARLRLRLFANRRRIWMTFEGTATQHIGEWFGCKVDPGPVDAPCQQWCIAIPREDAASAAFWAKTGGPINAKTMKLIKTRFGQAFTLTSKRDPIIDPSLDFTQVTPSGASSEQRWSFHWVMKFTPVHR
ncbi:MAG TPA: hypothetical protein VMT10_14615 [Solirubrobacteraceae bacterium]|nr:hypothetical protein [Solirubrobacteraceae bacterium]